MSVTLTVTLPASEFEIGRVVEAVDGVEIDLTMVVPLGDRVMPFLEVHDWNHDSFAERLKEHSAVASVVIVKQSDEEGTYVITRAPFCVQRGTGIAGCSISSFSRRTP